MDYDELVDEPPTIQQVSPDVVSEMMTPRDWKEDLWEHRKYKVVIDDGNPGYAPLFFKSIQKQLAYSLPKYVLKSDSKDSKDSIYKDLHPPKKWLKYRYDTFYEAWDEKRCKWCQDHVEWGLLVHPEAEASPRNAFRAMVAGNLAPPTIFARNRSLMDHNTDPAEIKARGLLKELIGKQAFAEYLRRGFLAVRGPSGALYHVRGGHHRVEVRDPRNPARWTEKLCIVFKDESLPFTDALIMRMMLIQTDEMGMRARSHVTKNNKVDLGRRELVA